MGRSRAIPLVLVLSLVAAATLSACGGEEDAELLPGKSAQEINANLDLVEQLVADGDCVGATNAAAAVSEQVEALTGVDQKLQETLAAGADRLTEVVVECTEAPEEDETTSAEEPGLEEIEREEKAAAKEAEEAEKEAEKEQKEEEKAEKETPPAEPPGQEKQQEETEAPPSEEGGGTPSGGVSPGEAAGGAE